MLLSIGAYRQLTGDQVSLADALAQDDAGDFDFDPPSLGSLTRIPDLT